MFRFIGLRLGTPLRLLRPRRSLLLENFVPSSYAHYGAVYFRGWQFALLYAVPVAHFLTPEAIPRPFIVPLRRGFEIARAGREMLANNLFI